MDSSSEMSAKADAEIKRSDDFYESFVFSQMEENYICNYCIWLRQLGALKLGIQNNNS